jgi:DNA processing protein
MGKDVFCIPTHDIFSRDYEGNTALLRDGAVPVFGAEDILDYYSGTYEYETMVFGETHEGDSDREDTEKQEVSEQRPEKSRYKTADPVERAVLDVIAAEGGSVHIDVIAEKSGYDISDVLIALTMLEMGGAVSQQAGKLYKLV